MQAQLQVDGAESCDGAILIAGDSVVVCNLNDIGWPPDQAAGDGIFSGALRWSELPAGAQDYPLTVKLDYVGTALEQLPAGRLALRQAQLGVESIACEPGTTLTTRDKLAIKLRFKQAEVRGRVYARVGTEPHIEFELYNVGRALNERVTNPPADGNWEPLADRNMLEQAKGLAPQDWYGENTEMMRDRTSMPKPPQPLALLPYGKRLPLTIEQRDADGKVLAKFQGPQIVIKAPEVLFTEFKREPAGPVEFGQPVTFKAKLNRGGLKGDLSIWVGQRALSGRMFAYDLEKYQAGDEIAIPLDYQGNGKLQPGDKQQLRISYDENYSPVSVRYGEPISLTQVAGRITSFRFDPAPPFKRMQHVKLYASCAKPIRGSHIALLVDGKRFTTYRTTAAAKSRSMPKIPSRTPQPGTGTTLAF